MLRILNLTLLILFPISWFAPLLRAGLLPIFGLSVVLTASFVLGIALAAQAVGVRPGPALFAAAPLVLLAMAVPLSFAGWGPRELSAALLWPALGATPEEGVAISAAYGLSVLLGALPGLAVWAWPERD